MGARMRKKALPPQGFRGVRIGLVAVGKRPGQNARADGPHMGVHRLDLDPPLGISFTPGENIPAQSPGLPSPCTRNIGSLSTMRPVLGSVRVNG